MDKELVNHPEHYKRLGIEPMDVIEEFLLDCHLGFAVKHIARAGHKGDYKVDLQRAKWYLERRLAWAGPRRDPLRGKLNRVWEVQTTWKLCDNLDIAVYNLLVSSTVADDRFKTCVQTALRYVEKELADLP